ncbi:MAG: hypothetical protein ACLRZ7_14090 [Lachnospiraceae bacterium]
MDFLCTKKNSVIIVNKKFERIIRSLYCSAQNTIIPITIEINAQDMASIQNAISCLEEDCFLQSIDQY